MFRSPTTTASNVLSKVKYVEHLGDVPFYSNPFLTLHEKMDVEKSGTIKVAKWAKKLEKKDFVVDLPFKINKLDEMIKDYDEAKEEFKQKFFKYYKSNSKYISTTNGYVRLKGIEIPKMPELKFWPF